MAETATKATGNVVVDGASKDSPSRLLRDEGSTAARLVKSVELNADLVIVGGGMAGTCAAITAARAGLKVVLMQDRPVLGGNASSEIRLWCLGATCHMGSNNRWAREGGVIDELLVENLYRNPEGNTLIFDTVLLEKVLQEPNIKLLLNTAAYECAKTPGNADRIASVTGYCSQNATRYVCRGELFLDASGDGLLGFVAGAAFRIGAESKEEFGEGFAPTGEFGHLLGQSIYFYSKDVGRPVTFVAPSYALKNLPGRIPRYKHFNAKEHGCRLWWIEYGGRLDPVHDTEDIKWQLWQVVYGVWDYIKNSGNFPEAANLTLEWVGMIPGKREARRFEGLYMLNQHDVVQRPRHEDVVAHGGWSIDLHPADGVFSEFSGSHHLHSKGVYGIPYRCYVSKNITNLFMAGRNISTTHVAFGTTRVMCTCAVGGQAVAEAAAICIKHKVLPAALAKGELLRELQQNLMRNGQHLMGEKIVDARDLSMQAEVSASSELKLGVLPADGPLERLTRSHAQLLPAPAGRLPALTLEVFADEETTLEVQLRTTTRTDHHTPDVTLASQSFKVPQGASEVTFAAGTVMPHAGYLFICAMKNPKVSVRCTNKRITGMLVVHHYRDETTAKVGGEDYEVWAPARRPGGQNFALKFAEPVAPFGPGMIKSGVLRPVDQAHAWVAAVGDMKPTLTLKWPAAKTISQIELWFDPDYDHAMESSQYGHPERAMPYCVSRYVIRDDKGTIVHRCDENHQARNVIKLPKALQTTSLTLEVVSTNSSDSPAAVFAFRAFA